ncbi:hypothetical protein QE152_g23043 [Popillia japonica]|uniref:Uncharacterized protein n=1 Tax=Popillia japonica TaxID=7064 RepID=A0AAW1KJ14_POPJA
MLFPKKKIIWRQLKVTFPKIMLFRLKGAIYRKIHICISKALLAEDVYDTIITHVKARFSFTQHLNDSILFAAGRFPQIEKKNAIEHLEAKKLRHTHFLIKFTCKKKNAIEHLEAKKLRHTHFLIKFTCRQS